MANKDGGGNRKAEKTTLFLLLMAKCLLLSWLTLLLLLPSICSTVHAQQHQLAPAFGGNNYPEPRIWLWQGHLQQADLVNILQAFGNNNNEAGQYEGQIIVGHPYTLVLEMSTWERWDFTLDTCSCNQQQFWPFAGPASAAAVAANAGGCLRPNGGHWLGVQEYRLAPTKFIVIHLLAPDPQLRIECQTRVVQCCGCCQISCDRVPMPLAAAFPSAVVPVSCAYPIGLPPPAPAPAAVAVVSAVAAAVGPPPPFDGGVVPTSCGCWPAFMPMFGQCRNAAAASFGPAFPPLCGGWLPLLLLCLLLLLLLLLCCLPLLFLFWTNRSNRRVGICGRRLWPIRKQRVHPPPPPQQPRGLQRIFTVDDYTQTNGAAKLPAAAAPPSPAVDYHCSTKKGEQQREERIGTTHQWHTDELPLSPPPPQTWFWSREVEETEEREEQEEWLEEEEARPQDGRRTMRGGGGGGGKFIEFLDERHHTSSGGQRAHDDGGGGYRYENWRRRPAAADGITTTGRDNNNNGWTRFGTEPMGGHSVPVGVDQQGEDGMFWRATSPGGAHIRELGQRSTYAQQQQ